MQVTITITDDTPSSGGDFSLSQLNEKVNIIMADQKQLAEDLKGVQTQLDKIGNETTQTLQKVAELEQAVRDAGQTSPEVDAALQALKDQAQRVDDMVADPSVEPSPTPAPPPAEGGGGEAPAPAEGGGGESPAPAPSGEAPAGGETDGTGARAAGGTIDRVTGQRR